MIDRTCWQLATLLFCLYPLAARAVTRDVSIVGFSFEPNNLTIAVGDTMRWTNNGGSHDVRADNGTWASDIGFTTYSRTFNTAEEIFYHCSVHSSPGQNINTSMNGRINVVVADGPGFAINSGLSDAWYFPETDVEGFLIIVWKTSRRSSCPGSPMTPSAPRRTSQLSWANPAIAG